MRTSFAPCVQTGGGKAGSPLTRMEPSLSSIKQAPFFHCTIARLAAAHTFLMAETSRQALTDLSVKSFMTWSSIHRLYYLSCTTRSCNLLHGIDSRSETISDLPQQFRWYLNRSACRLGNHSIVHANNSFSTLREEWDSIVHAVPSQLCAKSILCQINSVINQVCAKSTLCQINSVINQVCAKSTLC